MKKRGGNAIKAGLFILIALVILLLFLSLTSSSYIYVWPSAKITGRATENATTNPPVLVTINANKEIGRVREDFYGVNVHASWLRNGITIDTNSDGTLETLANTTWHRQMFLNAGLRYAREDASIHNCYYVNASNISQWYRTCNLTNLLNEYTWAKANGVRILNILSYMPLGLRNLTANCLADSQKCQPLDYDIWGKILVDYINATTNNGEYLDIVDYEIWNEPDLHQFLQPNLTVHGTQSSADIYVKLYNSSYTNIKNVYPNAIIIGPASAHIDIYTNITFSFLSNFSDRMDGFSFHDYYPADRKNVMTRINNALGYCTTYNANCSRILMDEYNYKNSSGTGGGMELSSSNLSRFYADIFIDGLNLYPANLSLMIYQWSEQHKYSDTTHYPEYPSRWSMVSESQLDNAFYPSYNVTKDFATYHAAGNMVVNSSSSNSSIKIVASRNQSDIFHITVINTGKSTINVSIDVSSLGVQALKDLKTDIIYPVSGGIANVGVLEQYDIKHYESILNYEVSEEENEINVSEEENETDTYEEKEEDNSPTSTSNTKKIVTLRDVSSNSNNEIISLKPNASNDVPTSELLDYIEENPANNKNKVYGPAETEEEEEQINKESNSEIFGNFLSSFISDVKAQKSYLIIILLLLASITCVLVIIYHVYKRKVNNIMLMKMLEGWVAKARALGYTNEMMREMLYKSNWDKELVERAVRMG